MQKILNSKLSEQDKHSKIVYQVKNFIEKKNQIFFSVYLMAQLLSKK
jgi:hypothetical protein